MTAAVSVWAVSASTTASMRAGMRHNSDFSDILVYKNGFMASVSLVWRIGFDLTLLNVFF